MPTFDRNVGQTPTCESRSEAVAEAVVVTGSSAQLARRQHRPRQIDRRLQDTILVPPALYCITLLPHPVRKKAFAGLISPRMCEKFCVLIRNLAQTEFNSVINSIFVHRNNDR